MLYTEFIIYLKKIKKEKKRNMNFLVGESSAFVTSLLAEFTKIGTDITSIITGSLPIVLSVVGGMVVIGVGLKVFKKLTSKA